ncbi:MAG: 5'/3'-nucleotidase SurE [Alistipes finegoldii]
MKEERLILVTNDDGYDSKGLAAAVEVARGFGRVVVVAPETTQSGMSQAITMYNPLYLRCVRKEEGLEVYAFSGTPVDCVKMAFDYLLREERVDLVISGINHGSNSAVNVLYSGTMGAAIEGSFYGCPAVGLSLDDHGEDADFEAAVAYGRRIVGSVLEKGSSCRSAERERSGRQARRAARHPSLPPEPRLLARGVLPPRGSPRPGVFLAYGSLRQRRAGGAGHRRMGLVARLRLGGARAGGPDGLPSARSACRSAEIIVYLQ